MMYRLLMIILWMLCVLACLIALAWMLVAAIAGHKRAEHLAFGFDQTANAAFGGHWDEKISSRAWRERNNSKRWYYLRMLIDVLFFFDPDHCETSFKKEQLEALRILQRAGA